MNANKVFLAPTEGLWGLSAPAACFELVQDIYALKNRSASKPFIVLYTQKTTSVLEQWVNWDLVSEEDLQFYAHQKYKFMSFLLPASHLAPRHLVLEKKISARFIHKGSIKRIINSLGQPIVSTSANISGQAPLRRLKLLKKTFDTLPIEKGRLGGKTGSSAIVDLISKKVLR